MSSKSPHDADESPLDTGSTPGKAFPSSSSLRRHQRKILEAIQFFLERGERPTVREVGTIAGLRSPATVLKHLRALETQGYLTLSGKSRGIRVLDRFLALFAPPMASESGEHPSATSPAPDLLRSKSGTDIRALPLPANIIPLSRWRTRGSELGGISTGSIPPGTPIPPGTSRGVPLVGAIAAGRPFESYSSGFFRDEPWNTGRWDAADQDSAPWDPDAASPSDLDGTSGTHGNHGQHGNHGHHGNRRHHGVATSTRSPSDDSPLENSAFENLAIDPRMFVESGEVFALKVKGDSMIRAGILDGDFVIIRRQDTVEEGEIAAVLIDGEGTLKRWHTRPAADPSCDSSGKEASRQGTGGESAWFGAHPDPETDIEMAHHPRRVTLEPANERFDPIEITEEDAQSLLVFGKYVGLVRGNLRLL